MFDVGSILTGFSGLVGCEQNHDSTGVQLVTVGTTDLTASSSGIYFNHEHPTLTFENLLSIAPNFERDTPSAEINLAFSTWLKKRVDAAIVRLLTEFWISKMNRKTGAGLIERKRLFDGVGNNNTADPARNKTVFIEIKPKRSKSLSLNLLKVGLQFTGVESIDLFLYEQGKSAAINNYSLDYTSIGDIQWFDLTDKLKGDKVYYLSYDQREIDNLPINSVNGYSFNEQGKNNMAYSRYAIFATGTTDSVGSSLPDVTKNSYDNTSNYGLNIEYSIQCDYTDFLIEQKNLFASLLSITIAIGLVHELSMNPSARENRNIHNLPTSTLLYEIDGDSQGRPGGLRKRYNDLLKALDMGTEGIDNVCLKCKQSGIKVSAI